MRYPRPGRAIKVLCTILSEFSFCSKEGTQRRKQEGSRRWESHTGANAQRRAARDSHPTALDCGMSKKLPFVQTHKHREQTCGCQGGGGVGERWIESLGLADAN